MSKSTHSQEYWNNQFQLNYVRGRDLLTNEKTVYYGPFNLADHNNDKNLFWVNPFNSQSLRLSKVGFAYVRGNTNLKYYKISIKEKIMPKTFLKLEKALTSPYYIENLTELFVLCEQDMIMLQLHNADLETYLDNILTNNQ